MKKAVLLLVALFIVGPAISQISFGPKAGMTLSKYGYNYADEDSYLEPETKFKAGPAIGVAMNMQILEFLSFQPSLMFSKKGCSFDVAEDGSGESVNTGYYREKISYLEVPLNVALGLKLGPVRFQVFAGPYFAYAIAGKQKWDYEENINGIREDVTGSEDVEFVGEIPEDGDVVYRRPFDIGANVGLGFKVDKILLNLGYAMGFANLQPDVPGESSFASDYKFSNRTIFLNVAWFFGE